MDLYLCDAADRIRNHDVLSKINTLLTPRAFSPIQRHSLGRSGIGPQGYDPLVLFKCLLIWQWHGLSEAKPERALRVLWNFMLFCGLDLHAPVPDETTHCSFCNPSISWQKNKSYGCSTLARLVFEKGFPVGQVEDVFTLPCEKRRNRFRGCFH